MAEDRIRVVALAITPVKSLRITARSEVLLERGGIRGDRAFFLVDELGRMVNGKHLGALNSVAAELDEDEQRLTLTFPSGEVLSGPIERGEQLEARFFSRSLPARVIEGPLSAALSEHAGQALRLVAPADRSSAIDRGPEGAVTMISQASLASLARAAGEREIDARRFRMSIELAGAAAHEEDRWVGRELRVGEARILLRGHVGRCIVTSRHPESGEIDLPTLDLLRDYRAGVLTTEPLAFGVYGAVLRQGVVRVGDAVELSGD
ncbi:MAG TPA: MOSC N-terminal beta barrel domain-containing protein [Solirubrobacteraceae bacterium]|jgi:uncharacterized protein YcbX|nr:MOSC N-terminal beta barrel domain-containing protein [Solirubrobacteraceae bacterium]